MTPSKLAYIYTLTFPLKRVYLQMECWMGLETTPEA